MRAGGPENQVKTVQRCKSERGSCAKVQKWRQAFRGAGSGRENFARGYAGMVNCCEANAEGRGATASRARG